MSEQVTPQGQVIHTKDVDGVVGYMPVLTADTSNARVDFSGYLYKEKEVNGVAGRMPVVSVEGSSGGSGPSVPRGMVQTNGLVFDAMGYADILVVLDESQHSGYTVPMDIRGLPLGVSIMRVAKASQQYKAYLPQGYRLIGQGREEAIYVESDHDVAYMLLNSGETVYVEPKSIALQNTYFDVELYVSRTGANDKLRVDYKFFSGAELADVECTVSLIQKDSLASFMGSFKIPSGTEDGHALVAVPGLNASPMYVRVSLYSNDYRSGRIPRIAGVNKEV